MKTSTNEIIRLADKFFLEYWNDKQLPVNVELVAEKAGLSIIPENLPENVDAYLTIDANSIIVNSRFFGNEQYVNRLRFSIAHELGHFVVHKNFLKSLRFSTVAAYLKFFDNLSENEHDLFEYQANEFAGRLLVPVSRLYEVLKHGLQELQQDGSIKLYEDNLDPLLWVLLPRLSWPFGVSDQVLEIRLKREELWPQLLEKGILK